MAESRGRYRNMSIFCLNCETWQPKDNFYRNAIAPSGRTSYCKPCYREINRANYLKRKGEML